MVLEFKEYIILVYKSKNNVLFNKVMRLPDWKNSQKNIDRDPRGNWQSGIFSFEEGHKNEDKMSTSYFEIETPSGKKYTRHWFCKNYDEYLILEKSGYLYFGKNGDSAPRIKIFENLEKEFTLTSILRGYGTSSSAKTEIEGIFFNKEIFDTPKPIKLVKELIRISSKNNSGIVLDFFSGSATTAHAVMQLNSEDNGNRKYIMVQLPETTDEKSEAFKAGYKNIAEIGKERIRRAGEKIKQEIEEYNSNLKLGEEPKKVPDIGFKVFKVDDTNIKWYDLENFNEESQYSFDDPDSLDFVLGSNDIDIVYEIMLRQNDIPLSESLEVLTDIGNRTYFYASTYLICLETEITEEMVEKLASLDPLPIKFVFRDSAFKDNISLKDETFRKLRSLIERNSGESKVSYRVEFI